MHLKKVPDWERTGTKGKVIKEIADAGLQVQSVINGWFDDEQEALEAERALINELGFDNLTNQNLGGGGKVASKAHKKLTPKQEQFCQNIVNGQNQSDAYRDAYQTSRMSDKQIWEEACKLSSAEYHPKVAQRIEELRLPTVEKVRKKHEVTLEYLIEKFEAAMQLAEQTDQPGAMTGALREMGKLLDIYPAERRENRNYDMTELSERIQKGRERVAQLKIIDGGKSDAGA
jgi:hypothetical protein